MCREGTRWLLIGCLVTGLVAGFGCEKKDSRKSHTSAPAAEAPDDDDDGEDNEPTTYTISGKVSYQRVHPITDNDSWAAALDYSNIETLPARRVTVVAKEGATTLDDTAVSTDDNGNYTLEVPVGKTVTVRIELSLEESESVADGIGSDQCAGAAWSVSVVDNTQVGDDEVGPMYVIDGQTTYSSTVTGANFVARSGWDSNLGRYDEDIRTGGMFSMLDDVVNAMELVCQKKADIDFGEVRLNWSSENSTCDTANVPGCIGGTYFTGPSDIWIVGKQNEDTDEYDSHVVMHEWSHFMLSTLSRDDTWGGSHSWGNVLDPMTAFSEGLATAVAAMAVDDPVYVDTTGTHQASGYWDGSDIAPTGNDRGVYSESSVNHLLWMLFKSDGDSFAKIGTVLMDHMTEGAAFTTLHAFTAYYRSLYGAGGTGGLKSLWGTTLATPWNSLCAGACSDAADGSLDLWDGDNDIGTAYALNRHYDEDDASLRTAHFWRLYQPAVASPPDTHSVADPDGYTSAEWENKWGMIRMYVYSASVTGNAVVTLQGTCTGNKLDMGYQENTDDWGWTWMGAFQEDGSCPAISLSVTTGNKRPFAVFGNAAAGPWTFSITDPAAK